ncbi:MAG: CaiB/BaiF CoA transferase family protein [Desulfococcaceae bacterium]
MTSSTPALNGIRVLDLSRVLAGPYCSMVLGDLGADVIKVERPGVGDDTRRWSPPETGGEAAYYLCLNRNKRSITVDLKSDAGRRIVRDLARQSDVVVENYKTGTLDRLGLGYGDLKAENPGLIYCSITGFGQTGPYRERAGYDFMIQAMGGIMSVTGEPDGPPMKVGVPIVDVTAGLYAATAILSALRHRDRTGEGQQVDMALLDAMVSWLVNLGSNYLVSGKAPERVGNASPNIVPYQAFEAGDGEYIALAVGNDGQWRRFCEIAGLDGFADDPRYATNPARVQNREVLVPQIAAAIRERAAEEWLRALETAKIPCGPVNTLDQVFADPQVLARNMRVEVPHPTAGTVALAGSPIKLSETPTTVRRHPPLLGEHTEEVLRELLGMGASEIAALRKSGAV